MTTTTVSVKGKYTPEYQSFIKNLTELESVLKLPVITDDVHRELIAAQMMTTSISQSDNSSIARVMVDSVLKCVEFNAMKFYKFLAILENLGNDVKDVLKKLQKVFYDEVQKIISSNKAHQPNSIKSGSAFLSFSRQTPYDNSVDSRKYTGKFYDILEDNGCNPWLDAEILETGDSLNITIFKTLDECKAVVPIVTKGYARSLWCMRELYYALHKKSVRLYPVCIEEGWDSEEVGGWLELTLKQVKMCMRIDPTDEQEMKNVALKITRALKASTTASTTASPAQTPGRCGFCTWRVLLATMIPVLAITVFFFWPMSAADNFPPIPFQHIPEKTAQGNSPSARTATATATGDTIENVADLIHAVRKIQGQWRELCMNLNVDEGTMNRLINSNQRLDKKMMECLQAYVNDGSPSWTEVVKAVAKHPVNNKRVAKEIAKQHSLDFDRILQDLKAKDEM